MVGHVQYDSSEPMSGRHDIVCLIREKSPYYASPIHVLRLHRHTKSIVQKCFTALLTYFICQSHSKSGLRIVAQLQLHASVFACQLHM
jgi:hypothetical protein